jgi:hypothetical protein
MGLVVGVQWTLAQVHEGLSRRGVCTSRQEMGVVQFIRYTESKETQNGGDTRELPIDGGAEDGSGRQPVDRGKEPKR